jgi:hypothetical protein
MGIGTLCWEESGRDVVLTTHLYVVLRLKNVKLKKE